MKISAADIIEPWLLAVDWPNRGEGYIDLGRVGIAILHGYNAWPDIIIRATIVFPID